MQCYNSVNGFYFLSITQFGKRCTKYRHNLIRTNFTQGYSLHIQIRISFMNTHELHVSTTTLRSTYTVLFLYRTQTHAGTCVTARKQRLFGSLPVRKFLSHIPSIITSTPLSFWGHFGIFYSVHLNMHTYNNLRNV